MKIVIVISLFLLHSIGYTQELDLNEVRKDFNLGVKDEELCVQHLNSLEKYADDPVERGYKGAYQMFMAKHTSNPFKKMNYFKTGKKILETEIDGNPDQVELRFIRLCIQYYIPKYLGYHHEIDQDKQFVLDNLFRMKDAYTKSLIYKYLKGAKMYSDEELALLRR